MYRSISSFLAAPYDKIEHMEELSEREREVHAAIADNTSLLAGILRLTPDIDIDAMVPCTDNEKVRCPLIASYSPTTREDALLNIRLQARRLQHALGAAQALGAHEWDLERALGAYGDSTPLTALLPSQGS